MGICTERTSPGTSHRCSGTRGRRRRFFLLNYPLALHLTPLRVKIHPVPEISRFFGIVIRMFYNDHAPPHFHAEYGEQEALIEIDTLAVYQGELSRRVLAFVLEWAALHRDELRIDWELARTRQPLVPVAPLE